jgi:hypothetical protein
MTGHTKGAIASRSSVETPDHQHAAPHRSAISDVSHSYNMSGKGWPKPITAGHHILIHQPVSISHPSHLQLNKSFFKTITKLMASQDEEACH